MYRFARGTIFSARTFLPSTSGTQPVSSNISEASSTSSAISSLVVSLTMIVAHRTNYDYFGRFTHPAGCCQSLFDNAGIAAAVVERRVRGWRGVRRAKLAEAAAH